MSVKCGPEDPVVSAEERLKLRVKNTDMVQCSIWNNISKVRHFVWVIWLNWTLNTVWIHNVCVLLVRVQAWLPSAHYIPGEWRLCQLLGLFILPLYHDNKPVLPSQICVQNDQLVALQVSQSYIQHIYSWGSIGHIRIHSRCKPISPKNVSCLNLLYI